uniref:Uncharacterized protein n=1 Tax=Anolis carolinensis TaxID=28377 RepID=A0A803TKC6_ANOCA
SERRRRAPLAPSRVCVRARPPPSFCCFFFFFCGPHCWCWYWCRSCCCQPVPQGGEDGRTAAPSGQQAIHSPSPLLLPLELLFPSLFPSFPPSSFFLCSPLRAALPHLLSTSAGFSLSLSPLSPASGPPPCHVKMEGRSDWLASSSRPEGFEQLRLKSKAREPSPSLTRVGSNFYSAVKQQDYSASVWLRRKDKLEHKSQQKRPVSQLSEKIVWHAYKHAYIYAEDDPIIRQYFWPITLCIKI